MSWYNFGTLSLTHSSDQVVGDHAVFTALTEGSGLIIDGAVYGVKSIEDADHLTLTRPYEGATASGISYEAFPTESRAMEMLLQVGELIALTAPLQGSVETFNSLIADKAAEVAASQDDIEQKHGEVISAHSDTLGARDDALAAQSASEAARDIAIAKRDEAVTAATTSTNAKATAEAARDLAEDYRDEANASATSASQDASDAAGERFAAQDARNAAQLAQIASESARDASVTAKDLAEAASTTAEDARGDALAAQLASEDARNMAEEYRDEIQSHIADAQSAKTAAEDARDDAQAAAEAAALSAEEASQFDPSTFATKAELSGKLDKTGGTISGALNTNSTISLTQDLILNGSNYTHYIVRPNEPDKKSIALAVQGGGPLDQLYVNAGNSIFTGNVGIGTSNPIDKLHVKDGYIRIEASAYPKLILNNTGNSSNLRKWQAYVDDLGNFKISSLVDAENAEQQVLTFSSQGRLGVGITDPTAKLDVAGSIRTTGGVNSDGGNIHIRNAGPTLYFRDTDNLASAIHCNSNILYFLRSPVDSTELVQVNGAWPLELNLTNNHAQFGGDITVYRPQTNGIIRIDAQDGKYAYLSLIKSGKTMWDIGSDTSANSGGNVGSDFYIHRFNNDGGYMSRPFAISRATGMTYINEGLSLSGPLNGFGISNQGSFIRRSNDVNANGNWSKQLVLAGGEATAKPWSAPIEIREVNQVGNTNGHHSNSPAIAFHWNQICSASIKLHADNSFRFQGDWDENLAYRPIWAGEHYAADGGWFRVSNSASGIYWEAYGRGLSVADNGANYGNINTYGTGMNGWNGYSINNWLTMMANGAGAGTMRGFYSVDNGGWLMYWDSGNNATFSGNITAYSDERLKQNKRPILDATERRAGMAEAAIIYERDGKTRIGFGAQTLEKSNPEVVFTADDLTQTKTVNYMDLVAILAVDNQQQQERIEELESEVTYLKSIIQNIENRLTQGGL